MTQTGYPQGAEHEAQLSRRSKRGTYLRASFLFSLMLAIVALLTLVFNILNSSFGLVAVQNEVEPSALVEVAGLEGGLKDLTKHELVEILKANVENNVGRRLERELRFYDDRLVFETQAVWDEVCARGADAPMGCGGGVRDAAGVYDIIVEQVVQPEILETWSLVTSLTQRSAIVANTNETYPGADLVFRSWLSWDFITSSQSPSAGVAGVRTAIFGSLWIVLITVVFSLPVGVGAAVYLEEYARPSRLNSFIQTNINNLAGVPSIIYGMLGLAIFVRALEPFTSGTIFGVGGEGATSNGRTILAAGLTLGLLILPVIIINAQEAVKAVPGSLRFAALALGATKWQTIRAHVLPNALPGILTGAILAVARALGETAPLVVIGASTFITTDPNGPFSKFTALPIQIYQWTARPQGEFRNIAAAAIVVLLVLLITLNATAIILRNRYARRT